MNDDTFLMGMVFVTEDPSLFQQAKAIGRDPGEGEGVQVLDHKAVLIDVDEIWDLRSKEPLSGVMQLVAKAHSDHVMSVYVIYEGDPEVLTNSVVPIAID